MSPFTFNPNDLQRLNRLVFCARGASNDPSGNRRSRRAGDGLDFLDFRPYSPGDDVRNVDWNLYGRLRQLFIRLNESPRQLSVTVLVDISRSMMFGSPITKLEQAQRLACALGFIAMRGGDRVFVYSFSDRIGPGVGPLTGARGLASLVRFLQRIEPGGASDLPGALAGVRAAGRHRGLVIVLSDFLNIANRERALNAIPSSGGNVLAVQILDGIDRGDGLAGSMRLRDSESGCLVDVKIDRRTLDKYREAFDADRERFESRLTGVGRQYLLASTHDHYLELVCRALRARAVLR
jgi:uncharacterized protein (DUF58 family)